MKQENVETLRIDERNHCYMAGTSKRTGQWELLVAVEGEGLCLPDVERVAAILNHQLGLTKEDIMRLVEEATGIPADEFTPAH